jgi:endonuclease/exonuclease/phosphatase family metal-dependent hydrolase
MNARTSFRKPARARRLGLATAVLALIVLTAAPAGAQEAAPPIAERRFTAMTYNLYLGADLAPIFVAPPGPPLVIAAGQVFAQMVQTNFPQRAEVIAREVVEESPAVVGLQEVALWETALLSSNPQFQTFQDFRAILLAELEERGGHYEPVATNVNFSGALPISATTLARLTMRDVILVRSDLLTSELKVSNPTSQNFQARLTLTIGGNPIQVLRGWSSVDVKVQGKFYRFVNTHLEAFSAVIRNLQAQELVAWMAESPLPVVLAGDLNSLPTDLTGAYGIMLGAGFVDAWVETMGAVPGFTAGQAADLLNLPSRLDHTVDYVMHNEDPFVDGVAGSGDIVGEELSDRTPSGLWPSDHAGVSVTLHIAMP